MNNNVDYVDYQPGHFHLRLNINGYEIEDVFDDENLSNRTNNSDNVNRREESLANTRSRDLTFRYDSVILSLKENDVPDLTSALNLLGLLAFRLNRLEAAILHFEAVIDKDKDNVNAMQNLAHVYAHLNNANKADFYNTQVQKLLGRSDEYVSEKQIDHKMACSLAEQAYAHAYDVGLMHYDERKDRLDAAIKIYDRAINIGASAITLPERRRWYFVMATIFVRSDTLVMWSRDSEKARLPGYNRAINLLKEIAKSDVLYHKVLSWAYLGILLEKQSAFETTPMAVHDCGFTGTDPLDCYSKAIQLAEHHPHILNRLSKVFLLLGKQELAVGTTTMAIETSKDELTKASSSHCRARINTSMYMKGLNMSKQGSSTMPDRSLLESAKKDLERVISLLPSLRAYVDMGQVCYYMGVDAIKESFVVNEEYVNTALKYFATALDCDMGDKLPELQLLRGKCLRVKGEERNALECFKRAIEMDREGSRNTQAFRCLMETLVVWYAQGRITKRDAIIDDVDNWIRLALDKFDNDVILAELKTLSHGFTHETLELCKGTIRAGKMTLAKLFFSIFPPSVVGENPNVENNI